MLHEPKIYRFPTQLGEDEDPIVISGIGLATSLGKDRETVWQAIQAGQSGIRRTNAQDGFGDLRLPCGMIDWMEHDPNHLKSIRLTELTAAEALQDAQIDWSTVEPLRFATSISSQFGDIGYMFMEPDVRDLSPLPSDQRAWWDEFLPCSVTHRIGNRFGLHGPRLCHATACASGLISTMAAARMIEDDQADYALCGAADMIHYFTIAAFHRLGVLADHVQPHMACRPFDSERTGFVMGEGAALFVLEKRSHALRRGARVYAELAATASLGVASHVTGLEGAVETLSRLIKKLVVRSGWDYIGPQYINAHGTGTQQNDSSELAAIRAGLGSLTDQTLISSNKAVLGHLINAAGSIELAITALAIRDGYAPPTMNLHNPEDQTGIDCLAECGVQTELDRAMKLSLAFGGHVVGMALQKSPIEGLQRQAMALASDALIRQPAIVTPAARSRQAA